MKNETKEANETLLTEVPTEETAALLTEVPTEEAGDLLTEGEGTKPKKPKKDKEPKGERVPKSTRVLQPKKEAPPEVVELAEKIAALELAKEVVELAEKIAALELAKEAEAEAEEAPAYTKPRRGTPLVKKKGEEYTPAERKALLGNFSRRTLRTRYGIEF